MSIKIELSPEVADAQAQSAPVVALESTIITHGMPFPQNLETATAVEQVIRGTGATPATIAVLGGELKIGLTPDELEQLATGGSAMKLSRADLAVAIARKVNGSTTVAATMIAAKLAEISFFATGGIGGVHRGVENSMDVSADLTELGRTAVTVVCAGAKAILDIPKTLEFLETQGVPVISYQSDDVPAFWSRSSGHPAPLRFDSVAAISEFLQVREVLGLEGGVLLTNPIPEDAEIPQSTIESWIKTAISQADSVGITGKAVTPYLLQAINTLSDGRSLSSNIALIKNNARLAAELAITHSESE